MKREHMFELTWSPEGRVIAHVRARSAISAKRKAPMPYRKYLGEIGVKCLDPESWYVLIEASTTGLLLGGVSRHVSSRFATAEQAKAFGLQCVEENEKANRPVKSWAVIGSPFSPEVI